MGAEVIEGPRRYGNLRRPGSRGVLGFGWGATIGAFVAILVVLVGFLTAGPQGGVVLLVVAAVALLPTRRAGRDGRTGYGRLVKLIGNAQARRANRDVLLQGPAGFTPDGKLRLPGLLASSQLRTISDPFGGQWGAVVQPRSGHWTIVMECEATGMDLVDPPTHDRQVAHWGLFLAMVGELSDVHQVQAVVETAPDTGMRLRDAVLDQRSDDSPTYATQVMDEVMDAYPMGEASIRTYVTVTFSARTIDSRTGTARRMGDAEMEQRIANAVPAILTSLRQSGAGETTRFMSGADIADMVRVAFDPTIERDVEEARRTGGTGLRWDEVGPVRLVPHDDRLRHDRVWSASWQMLEPPAGVFTSTQLRPLLAPHPDVMRKRVCLLYRPHGAEEKVRVVESDINASTFKADGKNRVSARQRREIAAAQQSAEEESAGAGLTRFGMIITVTVPTADRLPAAESALQQMKASARLRLRPCLGNQQVAFTAGLPLGLVLPQLTEIPAQIRELA